MYPTERLISFVWSENWETPYDCGKNRSNKKKKYITKITKKERGNCDGEGYGIQKVTRHTTNCSKTQLRVAFQ